MTLATPTIILPVNRHVVARNGHNGRGLSFVTWSGTGRATQFASSVAAVSCCSSLVLIAGAPGGPERFDCRLLNKRGPIVVKRLHQPTGPRCVSCKVFRSACTTPAVESREISYGGDGPV